MLFASNLLLSLLLLGPVVPKDPSVGDAVAHSFRGEPWNAPGLTTLSHWHGKVLAVLAFDLEPAARSAECVRLATELAAKHEPHLQVLLVPRGVPDEDALASYLIRERWLAHDLAWTTENVLGTGASRGVRLIVVDPSGRVAATHEGLDERSIERAVREPVEMLVSALGYAPDPLMSAYRRMQKGEVEAGFQDLRDLAAGKVEGVDRMIPNLAAISTLWWSPATHGRRDRIAKLLEEARFQEAEVLMHALLEEFPGVRQAADPFAEEVRALLATLNDRPKGDELDERKADQELEKALTHLRRKGSSKSVLGKLERVVEKFPGTKAADRARRWFGWAGGEVAEGGL